MSAPTEAEDRFYRFEHPEGPGFWVRELPYLIILALTLGGVGYISMARRPLIGYWEFMALFMGVVCVASGWRHAADSSGRWRLIWTQALHWGAFLVAMNLVLLPSVQAIADSDTTSLTILLLLALGTFIAGVHIASWRMCANGVIMALGVPAIAWLDQSALLLTLGLLIIVAIGATILWWRRAVR
ncbi:hypothetical protein [Methylocella tundrae]|jgi:hypothetical protein|uniref:Uncharacterized protein n=1 Tax=Methylocella tundrae TaxID=227605 RepID=A0A4U8YYV5_METTU|nr:hypothetical protein [Methylocella tundrae]WPP06115.1 hypothetical protein SIN04_10050 [Methylocella tundrae]VFU08727.1 conserved membrane protein of unknown function [Methylocella tundrae]